MTGKEIVAALRTTESRSKRELLDAAADLIEKLTDRCARYAEEIAVAQERTRWIPVTERLPEYDARVLAFDMRAKNKYIGIWTREKDPDDGNDCWFDSAGWWYAFDEITHWMPLPEPPKEER